MDTIDIILFNDYDRIRYLENYVKNFEEEYKLSMLMIAIFPVSVFMGMYICQLCNISNIKKQQYKVIDCEIETKI